MKRVAPALLVGAVVAAAMAQAAPTGGDLMRLSEQAERSHSYRGERITRMFFRNQVVDAVAQVYHQKPDTTRTEYIAPPAMAGTVILQIGAERWRRDPRDGHWWRMTPAPEARGLDLLRRNYDLRVAPAPPVANRPCHLLLLTPRHAGNPSKRMWVDQATGVVLRTELLNWHQQSISSSAFREIEVDPAPSARPDLLHPPARAGGEAGLAALAFAPVYPRYLPAGYVFSGTDLVNLGPHRGAHLRYSDGLNSISLFQAPAQAFGDMQPFESEQWWFAQVLTWRRGDLAYAVVGDINPAELRKMADSMGAAAPGG